MSKVSSFIIFGKIDFCESCGKPSNDIYEVVMPDGEWYEPGQMGWWGVSGASPKSQGEWDENYHKILEEADPNWTITIVDCHI